jgi:hypothetical protein
LLIRKFELAGAGAHFLGRGAFWIDLGHALAGARGFEKVGPRGDMGT